MSESLPYWTWERPFCELYFLSHFYDWWAIIRKDHYFHPVMSDQVKCVAIFQYFLLLTAVAPIYYHQISYSSAATMHSSFRYTTRWFQTHIPCVCLQVVGIHILVCFSKPKSLRKWSTYYYTNFTSSEDKELFIVGKHRMAESLFRDKPSYIEVLPDPLIFSYILTTTLRMNALSATLKSL